MSYATHVTHAIIGSSSLNTFKLTREAAEDYKNNEPLKALSKLIFAKVFLEVGKNHFLGYDDANTKPTTCFILTHFVKSFFENILFQGELEKRSLLETTRKVFTLASFGILHYAPPSESSIFGWGNLLASGMTFHQFYRAPVKIKEQKNDKTHLNPPPPSNQRWLRVDTFLQYIEKEKDLFCPISGFFMAEPISSKDGMLFIDKDSLELLENKTFSHLGVLYKKESFDTEIDQKELQRIWKRYNKLKHAFIHASEKEAVNKHPLPSSKA